MSDTVDTEDVVCPYCGTEWCNDQAAFYPDFDEIKKGEHDCEECGQTFKFSVCRIVTCSTFKIPFI